MTSIFDYVSGWDFRNVAEAYRDYLHSGGQTCFLERADFADTFGERVYRELNGGKDGLSQEERIVLFENLIGEQTHKALDGRYFWDSQHCCFWGLSEREYHETRREVIANLVRRANGVFLLERQRGRRSEELKFPSDDKDCQVTAIFQYN